MNPRDFEQKITKTSRHDKFKARVCRNPCTHNFYRYPTGPLHFANITFVLGRRRLIFDRHDARTYCAAARA